MAETTDLKKEIARKYMLPARPFLHGMASAFDLFGVLEGDRSERLLANLNRESVKSADESMKSVWREVGELLLRATDEYDREVANGGTS